MARSPGTFHGSANRSTRRCPCSISHSSRTREGRNGCQYDCSREPTRGVKRAIGVDLERVLPRRRRVCLRIQHRRRALRSDDERRRHRESRHCCDYTLHHQILGECGSGRCSQPLSSAAPKAWPRAKGQSRQDWTWGGRASDQQGTCRLCGPAGARVIATGVDPSGVKPVDGDARQPQSLEVVMGPGRTRSHENVIFRTGAEEASDIP